MGGVFRWIADRLFFAPQEMTRETSRLYVISKCAYLLGMVMHTNNCIVFFALGTTSLVLFNIGSVGVYALCFFLVVRFRLLILPFCLGPIAEIQAHALVTTLALGLSSGWFIFAMVPAVFTFVMPVSWRIKILLSVIAGINYILIGVIGVVHEPWYELSRNWTIVFILFNTLGTSCLFALVFALYYRIAETAESALEAEYERSEALLYNLLPEEIAARLKLEPDRTIADSLPNVAILFADIVDFTPRAARLPPEQVVGFLNRIFSVFDELADKHGLEKIKTVGDAYMVAAGMPSPVGGPVHRIAEMALDMQAAAQRMTQEFPEALQIGVGLHAGPAVAGVIGNKKLFYDVWGETVNMASRMESLGEPGRIQVTGPAYDALNSDYRFTERGAVEVKGMGIVQTWWLTGRRGSS